MSSDSASPGGRGPWTSVRPKTTRPNLAVASSPNSPFRPPQVPLEQKRHVNLYFFSGRVLFHPLLNCPPLRFSFLLFKWTLLLYVTKCTFHGSRRLWYGDLVTKNRPLIQLVGGRGYGIPVTVIDLCKSHHCCVVPPSPTMTVFHLSSGPYDKL